MNDFHTHAIALPTGTRINPATGEGEYADDDQAHYIIDVGGGRLRDFTSFGSFDLNIDDRVNFMHDQTRRELAFQATVIGIRFANGQTFGQVPDKRIPHWVAK
jgi:hypothetical protein